MTTLDMLVKRNQEFARHQFNARLSPMGRLKTMIVSCVDARVDPAFVLGLEAGDAMVIRTLGGRITPATLQTITLLLTAAQVLGANPGALTSSCCITHSMGSLHLYRSPICSPATLVLMRPTWRRKQLPIPELQLLSMSLCSRRILKQVSGLFQELSMM